MLTDVQERISGVAISHGDQTRTAMQSNALNVVLRERLERLPQADVIAVIGSDGTILNTTRTWPAPSIDVKDRDYFQHFSKSNSSAVFVSKLFRNRVNGEATIFFSKRLADPQGDFVGVILIGLKLSEFQRLYDSINSVRDLSYSLLRRDGTLIIRHPGPQQL